MIEIGKIVYSDKLVNHKPLPYVVYHKYEPNVHVARVKNYSTLIVGWKLVNEIIPKYPHDILEREIDLKRKDKYFWEFSFDEDNVQYTQGLEAFIKKLPYLYISKFEYKNADPIFNGLFTLDDLDKFLPSDGYLYVYKNEIAYYFDYAESRIYGIKLSVYEYMGVPVPAVIDRLVKKSKRHFLDDSTEYQKYYKHFPEFGLLKRSMVVFLFS